MRAVVFGIVGLVGCAAPDMTGNWEGELDCGSSNRYDIEMDLEAQGETLFIGEGTAEFVCVDGSRCDLEFEIEFLLGDREDDGSYDLQSDFDDCSLRYQGGSSDFPCPDLDNPVLESSLTLTADFELENLDCDLDMSF